MIDYVIYSTLAFFGLISLIFIILILTQKKRHNHQEIKVKAARCYLFAKYIDNEDIEIKFSTKFFLDALIDIDEQIHLESEVRKKVIADLITSKFIKKQIKLINSLSKYKRQIAVFYVGKIRTEEFFSLLFERFLKEKSEVIKISIVRELRYGMRQEYIQKIFESLIDSSENYQRMLTTILGNNYKRIFDYMSIFFADERPEIIMGLSRIGSFHADSSLVDYLQKRLEWLIADNPFSDDLNNEILKQILQDLYKHTPEIVINKKYLNHENLLVKEFAIKALGNKPTIDSINYLVSTFDESRLDETRVDTLSKMIEKNKTYLDHLLRIFLTQSDYNKKMLIALFSDHLDYIILKTSLTNPKLMDSIIDLTLNYAYLEPIIDFLNNNTDLEIENLIIEKIKNFLIEKEDVTNEFRAYLNQEILNKLGLQAYRQPEKIKDKVPAERKKIIWIIKWITFTFLLFPIIFLIKENINLFALSFVQILEKFLIDVNIYLIFYFLAINLVYVILFIFALDGSKKQVNLAKIKKYSLLFTDKLLPGISIIAPAFNEELSIVESVTSLLNLKYPNYEVIVINDGSRDKTLEKLIAHFGLERKHPSHKTSINTKKIRGIYQTKDIPNLIVVDKFNGGKADALNVGINVSAKDYVCGIDADSILEGDALLKLASAMLDDSSTHIAMGGNIYPANGFKINHGQVEERSIAKETICRFQTIEYLRAFTSGRIGWSQIGSLMIISGAFGLFRKKTLISAGGYLTSSGSYKKDTVGEDMELVVRLTKLALQEKKKFKVAYVYNAYCYTELPSNFKTLLRQRNRWQRGLIDILSFHRDIAFNTRYKKIGFIGYPYFFFFEFLGSFFESIGYLMLIIAMILGLLNPIIIVGIFTVSIIFGVMISLSALFMMEKEKLMMSTKDTLIMIFYALIENFGYRQLMSLHRVVSTFSALKESGSWGTQVRKGFQNK